MEVGKNKHMYIHNTNWKLIYNQMVDYCLLYVLQEFRDCIVSEADWKEYSMWGEETSSLGWSENDRGVCWGCGEKYMQS